MRTQQKVQSIEHRARLVGKRLALPEGTYPSDVVDLIIFHKLHLNLPLSKALKSFHNLKTTFVDWNEVRVSSVREIHEAVCGSVASLPLAVFVKELLEFVHREQQVVSLEFLVEQNLADIRRYLKKVRGVDPSTVNLVLRVRKEHPVLPLSRAMEAVIDRVGLLRSKDNRDKKERALHDLVGPDRVLAVHHFLLNHSQERCPPDVERLDCPRCSMKSICAFYASGAKSRPRATPNDSKNGSSRKPVPPRGEQSGKKASSKKRVAAKKESARAARTSRDGSPKSTVATSGKPASAKRSAENSASKNSSSRRRESSRASRRKVGVGAKAVGSKAVGSKAVGSKAVGSASSKQASRRRPRLGK